MNGMSKKERKQKEKWAKSLKVGDIVCDCRCKHSPIKEISYDYRVIYMGLYDLLDRLNLLEPYTKLCKKIGFVRWPAYGINILTEDEYSCSAMHCCSDPTTHEATYKEKG